MKKICFLILLLTFTGVLFTQAQLTGSSSGSKKVVNRERIDALNGRPIEYYLNNSNIDSYSKKFYKGEIAVSNEARFSGIIDSVLTENQETRPFYFFIFNRILDLSQGSLVEHISKNCYRFISNYPCDFFSFLNSTEIELNVVRWNSYLGSQFSSRNDFDSFRRTLESRMKLSCNENQDLWKSFFSETRTCVSR